jgi:endonuclease/exonuclease/phosphatase family metal-dependent hydrolase
MRCVSFNIQRRPRESAPARAERIADCAAFLRELRADALCLQEVEPAAWPALRATLRPIAVAVHPRQDGRARGEAVPVLLLSRDWTAEDEDHFWFSETPEHPSAAWGAAHPRICSGLKLRSQNAAVPPVWIYSLHLDHRSQIARARSLELLERRVVSRLRGDETLVLCGDFNMPPYRQPLLHLARPGGPLRNATHFHPVEALTPTYLGWGPFHFLKGRIDHCLHSPEWTVNRYRAVAARRRGRRLSDHRALVVDLSPAERVP